MIMTIYKKNSFFFLSLGYLFYTQGRQKLLKYTNNFSVLDVFEKRISLDFRPLFLSR